MSKPNPRPSNMPWQGGGRNIMKDFGWLFLNLMKYFGCLFWNSMKRVGCLFLILVLALFWGGGQGVYVALTNSSPRVMTLAEYCRKGSPAKWLQLEKCQINLVEYTVEYTGSEKSIGKTSDFYVPLRNPDTKEKGPIKVMLKINDPAKRKLILQFLTFEKQEKKLEKLIENKWNSIVKEETVEGLVLFGIDSSNHTRKLLKNLEKNLAEDFIILDENKKPAFLFSLLFFGGGVVLLVIVWFISSSEVEEADSEKETQKRESGEEGQEKNP